MVFMQFPLKSRRGDKNDKSQDNKTVFEVRGVTIYFCTFIALPLKQNRQKTYEKAAFKERKIQPITIPVGAKRKTFSANETKTTSKSQNWDFRG